MDWLVLVAIPSLFTVAGMVLTLLYISTSGGTPIVQGLLGWYGGKQYANLPFYTEWEVVHDNQVVVSGNAHTGLLANTHRPSRTNYLAGVYVLDVARHKRGVFRLFFIPKRAVHHFPNANVRQHHFRVLRQGSFNEFIHIQNVWVLTPVNEKALTSCAEHASNMEELATCASTALGIDMDVIILPVYLDVVRVSARVLIPAERKDDFVTCLNTQPYIVKAHVYSPDTSTDSALSAGHVRSDVAILVLSADVSYMAKSLESSVQVCAGKVNGRVIDPPCKDSIAMFRAEKESPLYFF